MNKKQLKDIKSVFLTTDGFGITTTSANYLANLAKEVIQEKKISMENISFVNSKVITTDCPQGLDFEKAYFDLDALNADIKRIGEMNTFIAWMREGIKAKSILEKDTDDFSFEDWLESKDIELDEPTQNEAEDPTFLDGLSVGERLRMLRAEAVASAYGKMVHPDSPMSKARKTLIDRIVRPTEITENYSKGFRLTSYTPAIEVGKVDEVFLKLQNEQRNAEKEFNRYNYDAQERKHLFAVASAKKFATETDEYTAKKARLRQEYETEMEQRRHDIGKLKILVPDALHETYNYLNGLGK